MLTIDLKSRLRNKTFILAMVGAIVLLVQQLGFKDIIPSNYSEIVNSILTLLTMVGIVVDTSTNGISDPIVATATVQAVNKTNEVKTEGSTTSINNNVTENSQISSSDTSASSKVVVDNPENIQEIGEIVNATSATTPN